MSDHTMVPNLLKSLVATTILWWIIPNGLAAQETDPLRWTFRPNETFKVELEQETGITSNIDTRGQQIGNRMQLFMDWKILKVEDEVAVIEQVVNRITLRINSPSGGGIKTTELDTDTKKTQRKLAGQLQKQIQPLVGATFQVRLSSRGEILDVEIPRETMDTLRQAPSSMQLRQAISEAGLKDWIGQSAIVFPENGLASGDEWQAEVDLVNSLGKIKKMNRYVYDGLVEQEGVKRHQISLESSIEVEEKGEVDATIESFSGKGTFWFAADQAIMLESRAKNKMKTTRKYRDQTITSTVTTSVSMKVTKQ